MKKASRLVALSLVFALLLGVLSACAPSMGEVAGTYSGSYTFNGNLFSKAFVLTTDGRFVEATVKNGQSEGVDQGTYEIKGNKLRLKEEGSSGYAEYTYRNGTIENNGHVFYKSN